MAAQLRVTPIPPIRGGHRSPATSSSSSSCNLISNISNSSNISFNLKQQQQQQQQKKKRGRGNDIHTSSSPLPTAAEELASRFGLQMAIADLERLYRQAGADGGDPPVDGSSGRPVRVAYQGVRGSYCQEAAAKAFPSLGCQAFPCSHMEDAFAALEDRSADRAVVAVENSIDGPIDRNFDLLLRHAGVRIVGELILPVNHCLLSLPGASRSAIRRIVSHPQALSHCQGRLHALDLEVDEVSNAADAARFLAENRISDTAVIGSKIAAREFGLRVLEDNFQDRVGNFNRFFQLGLVGPGSSSDVGGRGPRKATVAFSLEKGVSDLFRAMWMFESRGVKVTRVEHRPNRSNPVRVVEREGTGEVRYFDYVFILDLELEGTELDSSVEVALAGLGEIAGFVRVLGSYTYTRGARE